MTNKEMVATYNFLIKNHSLDLTEVKRFSSKKEGKKRLAEAQALIPEEKVNEEDQLDWNISAYMVLNNGAEQPTNTLRAFAKAVQEYGDTRKVYMDCVTDHNYNKGTAARQWQEVKQGKH